MIRSYSDSGDERDSKEIRRSGWQSAQANTMDTSRSASALIRLVVDSPFVSKKCSYTIDKSQRGRLMVTAHRRRSVFSAPSRDDHVTQTYPIPADADVDRLQSFIERHDHRLIIEIPRLKNYYSRPTRTYDDPNRRMWQYRVDCLGYTADDLDVHLQGNDLVVHGENRRGDRFSRKISVPPTVDYSAIVSYLENGQLKIRAPFRSVTPSNHRHYYRRHQRASRHGQMDNAHPMANSVRRIRSAESISYPYENFYDDSRATTTRRRRYSRPYPSDEEESYFQF